ncbi:MAG: alpha/beta hydrolase-fold protein [Halioglobus sp.]
MPSTRLTQFAASFSRPLAGLCLAGALLAGCSDGSDSGFSGGSTLQGCADTGRCVSNPPLTIGGDRPAAVQIPVDYNTNTRYPLLILLHGFGANGIIQALYMGLDSRVDSKQIVLVMPDGTLNSGGRRFWNATAACCARTPEEQAIDDVAYISGLIEEAAATYSIDPTRVGLLGHSNGGFMALRMACEASEIVTSVVSLAGSTFADEMQCAPATRRVSVAAIHGDNDDTIFYNGVADAYPGAVETAERFAVLGGCDVARARAGGSLDLIESQPGEETVVTEYPGCLGQTAVELWTIIDGVHIPAPWSDTGSDALVEWLLDHPRD